MANILEMAAESISSHASKSRLTAVELLQEIQKVYATLQSLKTGKVETSTTEQAKPAITIKEAFKKNEVICMICGKGGMKTLSRHLRTTHNLKPGEYKKQCGIKSKQPLTARSFTEERRKLAEERGLGEQLIKARAKRQENIKANKAPVPAVRVKPAVPAIRTKPSVPAIKEVLGKESVSSSKTKKAPTAKKVQKQK